MNWLCSWSTVLGSPGKSITVAISDKKQDGLQISVTNNLSCIQWKLLQKFAERGCNRCITFCLPKGSGTLNHMEGPGTCIGGSGTCNGGAHDP